MNHLQEQGFKVYCPQIPKYDVSKEVAGKQVLFRGDCFVESGEPSVSSIRSTLGIIAFGSEGKPALVSAGVLDEVRRVEAFYVEKSLGL